MIKQRVKKSEKIPGLLRRKLENLIKKEGTKVDAAEKIGISRMSLDNILKSGTCSTETLLKIKNTLK